MQQTHGGQEQCQPQLRCHPMGLQPLLCSLLSPGWFMLTVSPPAKTTATAWLRSPVMREAAATCEIRAWYHISGNGEGSLVGTDRSRCTRHREAMTGAVGMDGAICPHGRDKATSTLRWVLAFSPISMLHKQS